MGEVPINTIDATPIEAEQSTSGNDKGWKPIKNMKLVGMLRMIVAVTRRPSMVFPFILVSMKTSLFITKM